MHLLDALKVRFLQKPLLWLCIFFCHATLNLNFASAQLSGIYSYEIPGTTIRGNTSLPGLFTQMGVKPDGKIIVFKRKFLQKSLPNSTACLYLGEIRSADRVYVNSKLIGKTGEFPPSELEVFDRERCYPLDSTAMRKGVNELTIEIYSPQGQRQGGILAKDIEIRNHATFIHEQFFRLATHTVLVSLLILMAFFFMGASIFFRYESGLVIGLLNFVFSLYLLFSGQIKYLMGENLYLLKKFEYSFLALIPVFFFELIAKNAHTRIRDLVRVFQALNLFFLTAFLMPYTLTQMLDYLYVWQQSLPIQIAGIIFVSLFRIPGINTAEPPGFTLGTRRISSVLSYTVIGISALADIAGLRNYHSLPRLMPFAGLSFFSIFLVRALFDIRNIIISEKQNRLFVSKMLEMAGISGSYAQLSQLLYQSLNRHYPSSTLFVEILGENGFAYRIGQEENFAHTEILKLETIYRGKIYFHNNHYPPESITPLVRIFALNEIQVVDEKNTQLIRQKAEKDHLRQEKQLEIRKRKDLAKLNKLRTDLFAGFSHDIRTPLSLLTIQTDILEKNARQNPTLISLAQSLKRGTYSLLKSVNSMLDTVQSIRGNSKSEKKLYDLIVFLKNIVEYCNPVFAERGGGIRLFYPEYPVLSELNREKLERIVLNFISNSYKYAPESLYLEIEISIFKNRLKIKFVDSGKGISPKLIRKIRNSGGNLSHMRTSQGAGLGLSLAISHVHSMKGKMSFQRKSGKFIIILSFPCIQPHIKQPKPNSEYSFYWTKMEAKIMRSVEPLSASVKRKK